MMNCNYYKLPQDLISSSNFLKSPESSVNYELGIIVVDESNLLAKCLLNFK
jgi:hypothetical protein